MKAEKLKSGNWRVKVYLGRDKSGKQRFKSITARTEREALAAAREYSPVENGSMTVIDACRQYLDIRGPVLSPATVRGYKKVLSCHIDPYPISVFKIEKLSSPIVQKWVSSLSSKMSPKSVRNAYGFFSAALSFFSPDLRFRIRLPQRRPASNYTPTIEDINAVLSVSDPELRKAILLGATAMMRRGEICALTAEDVNLLKGTVRINKSISRDFQGFWVEKPPKTVSSNREIRINRELLSLFPPAGNIVDLKPDQVTMRFNRAVKKAGVHPFRFHDLRHFAASIAVSSAIGAGKLTIRDRGGWETDHVLESVYEHSVRDVKEKDTEKILSFFSEKIKFANS